MPEPHAPRDGRPSNAVLGLRAVVRDVETGLTQPVDDWIVARMQAEARTREECRDELMNAVARGDLAVVNDGT